MNDFTTLHVPGRRWYAIETRGVYDKRTILALQRKKIEVFCPLIKIKKQYWDGAVTIQSEPLFPSILFVKLSAPELNTVMHTDGVVHFLYWLDSFAIVSEKDIAIIKEFQSSYEKIHIEKIPVSLLKEISNDDEVELLPANTETKISKTLTSLGYIITTTDRIKQKQVIAI